MVDLMAEAVAERAEFLALLRGLDAEQWEAPSLCEAWRVRDVAAHVVSYDDLGNLDVARLMAGAGFSPSRLNEHLVRRLDTGTVDDLLATWASRPRPEGFGGATVGLVDGLIHQQDVRRPLGLPREVPAVRLRHALDVARWAPPLRGAWTVRGVRVVATDLDWTHGRGPEARGTGEAVLMALAGRRGVARELSGPGAERLARRLG